MIVGLKQCDCELTTCVHRERCVLRDRVAGDFYPELKLYTGGALEEKRPGVYGDCIIHCESKSEEDE